MKCTGIIYVAAIQCPWNGRPDEIIFHRPRSARSGQPYTAAASKSQRPRALPNSSQPLSAPNPSPDLSSLDLNAHGPRLTLSHAQPVLPRVISRVCCFFHSALYPAYHSTPIISNNNIDVDKGTRRLRRTRKQSHTTVQTSIVPTQHSKQYSEFRRRGIAANDDGSHLLIN